jgi:hypothetical protein
MLAWIPLELLTHEAHLANHEKFRILKLLRIPRLIDLLNIEKFKGILLKYH